MKKKEIDKGRIRKSGGGRKRAAYKDKTLQEDIKTQVERQLWETQKIRYCGAVKVQGK